MPRCVAYGCSIETSDGVSLYAFPQDVTRRKKWTKFVSDHRKDFHQASNYSVLCALHFVDEDFVNLFQFEKGFAKGLRLQPQAIPSVSYKSITNERRFRLTRKGNYFVLASNLNSVA